MPCADHAARRERARAVALRREGRSYREIMEALGVPKSTLSNWLKNVPMTDEQRELLRQPSLDGIRKRSEALRARRVAADRRVKAEARAEIGALTDRELFIAGVVAYWAEGSKGKPWRPDSRVRFINSDPTMITLFLRWLRLLGFGPDDMTFRVQIHESADVSRAERYWADIVGIDPGVLLTTTLKRHNPKTNRRNVGSSYVGCLTIEVRRSTDLYRRIVGWYEGIVDPVGRGVAGHARRALIPQAGVRLLAPQRTRDDGRRRLGSQPETLFEAPLVYPTAGKLA